MLQLVHTADWQIGRQFGRFDEGDAARLAAARIETVAQIGAHASKSAADLIVVAGDVFDAPVIGDKTIRRLFSALSAFSGPWVLLPGNHDAALAAGVWARARELGCVPANAHLATDAGEVRLDAIATSVLVAPLTQRSTRVDLTAGFDAIPTPEGYFRIGLAHGSVTGVLHEAAGDGNPISPERARDAQLEYLALGDWHGTRRINDRVWYSGTPEPDRFRDNSPGSVLMVRVEAPGAVPVVTPHRIAQFSWQAIEAELTLATDVDALLIQLAALGPQDVLRLRLSGQLSLADRSRVDEATNRALAAVAAGDADLSALALEVTDEELASLQADGYLADVLQMLGSPGADIGLDQAVRREALQILARLLGERGGAAR